MNPAVGDAWWIAALASWRLGQPEAAAALLAQARRVPHLGEAHRAAYAAELEAGLAEVVS